MCLLLYCQPTTTAGGSYEQAVSKEGAKFSGDKVINSQQKRGIQTHPDGRFSFPMSGKFFVETKGLVLSLKSGKLLVYF